MPKIHPESAIEKAKIQSKKRFCFFGCWIKENAEPEPSVELFKKNPLRPVESSVNPLRDTVRLLGFTDQNHRPITAFMVIQAVKNGNSYSTPILYASLQAEVVLNSDKLVGLDLTDFIVDPHYSNSRMVDDFFEKHLKTDKNVASFLNKGLHGLRSFSVKFPNDERAKLNFKFNYTIGRDPKTNTPIFYMIVHIPTQLEINNSKSHSFSDLKEAAIPDVVFRMQ